MEQAKKRLSDAFDSWELAYKDWLPLTRHYIDHEEEDAAFYRMVFARQELQSAFVELKQLMTPDEFRAYISEPPSLWKRLFRR